MNIAQTASETTEVKVAKTQVFVNIDFKGIADGINQAPPGSYQFNGKGRIIAALPPSLEDQYVYYSWDSAGSDHIPQPIPLNNGEKVKFIVQEVPGSNCNANPTWKGIIQNIYALQLVSGKKSTYLAVNSTDVTEEDKVTFNVKFRIKGEKVKTKYLVSWDPRVKVKRL